MKIKKAEEKHIEAIGEAKFERAIALASFEIRRDARLTGLDKIIEAVAFEAALQATGFGERPLILPRNCGNPLQETQDICEELLARAVKAATGAMALTGGNEQGATND